MPTGLIIALSAIVPIVMVVVILTAVMKGQAKTDELLRTGLPARGRILQLGTTGGSVAVMGHRHLNLLLTVEVQSPINGAVYTTTFQQLVSELQIPSVQPGTLVELRIDPQNPQRLALAGTLMQGLPQQQGFPQQQGYRQPGLGQPMGVSVMTPNYKSAMPRVLIITLLSVLPVTLILGYTFIDWGSLLGRNSGSNTGDEEESADAPAKKKTKSKGACARAAACCKVVAQGAGAQACENFEKELMPVEGCKQALEGYESAAKAMKKSCD